MLPTKHMTSENKCHITASQEENKRYIQPRKRYVEQR